MPYVRITLSILLLLGFAAIMVTLLAPGFQPDGALRDSSESTRKNATQSLLVGRVVPAVADLASLSLYNGQRVTTQGRAAAGDGGGNTYYFAAGSTATVDDGFVLAATGGRYIATDQRRINTRQWGVTHNGSTDDATAFHNCVERADALGIPLRIAEGQALLSTWTAYTVTNRLMIEAEGEASRLTGRDNTATYAFLASDDCQISIKGVTFDNFWAVVRANAGVSPIRLRITGNTCTNCERFLSTSTDTVLDAVVHDNEIYGNTFLHGIQLTRATGGRIRCTNNHLHSMGRSGLACSPITLGTNGEDEGLVICTGNTLDDITCESGAGILTYGGDSAITSNNLQGFAATNPALAAAIYTKSRNATVSSNAISANPGQSAIVVKSIQHSAIIGNVIRATVQSPDAAAAILCDGTNAGRFLVSGNSVFCEDGNLDTAVVLQAVDQATVVGNSFVNMDAGTGAANVVIACSASGNNIHIDNNTCTGMGLDVASSSAFVRFSSGAFSNVKISNNQIVGDDTDPGYTIGVEVKAAVTFDTPLEVVDNTFVNISYGLSRESSTDPIDIHFIRNQVRDVSEASNQVYGLLVNGAIGELIVTDNTFKNQDGSTESVAGLWALPSTSCGRIVFSRNRLEDFTTSSSNAFAFRLQSAINIDDLEIVDNYARDMKQFCRLLSGTTTRTRIIGNEAYAMSANVFLDDATDLTYGADTVIADNYLDGQLRDNVLSVSFADGDTTPSVASLTRGRIGTTANNSATTITTFDNGVDGQQLQIVVDANTTIANGSGISTPDGLSFTPSSPRLCTFVRSAGTWYMSN